MSDSTVKRIRRSAAEGNKLELVQPTAITLCRKPSNQRAFSILRSEDGKSRGAPIRRQRRSDTQRLARVEIAATVEREAADTLLKSMGLDTFEVSRSDDSKPWVAVNGAIVCTDEELIPHKINSDITAFVVRSEEVAPTEGKHQIILSAIRFDDESLTRQDVVSWLDENGVDYDENSLNNSSGNFVLQRAELEEGTETRQIELSEGVVGVVARSSTQDIPDGFVLVVNELAYCGWGWGQLDFDSYLADRTIGAALSEARDYLGNVLDNILYYNSGLTVDAKKVLVSRATDQFASYVNRLLDALPRQLLIQTTTEAITQRSEAVKEPAPMTTSAAKPTQTTGLTLDDVKAAIRADREEHAAEVKRKEEAEAETKRVEEARRAEMKEVAEAVAKPLLEEIAALKGATVLRSAGEDAETKQKDDKEVKRSESNLWTGALGDLGGLRDVREMDAEDDDSGEDEPEDTK